MSGNNAWRSSLIFAAAPAAGCTGRIGGSSQDGQRSSPNGPVGPNGQTGSSAAGGSGVSTTGSGSNPAVCDPTLIAGTSQIPRLTNAQYDRTVRDLLGVTGLTASGNAAPSSILATDQAGSLTSLGWSSYQSVAEMIAAQVIADPTLKANFLKCTPSGDGTACLHDTILQFGRRAFRRPLADAEVSAFDAIVAQGAQITATGAPDEIAEALLYMFLISPSFLQRAETAEVSDGAGHFTLSRRSRSCSTTWSSPRTDRSRIFC
jgi:Protein of unknown function (DUF1595)/Protein of unknown function (DUF1587)